MAAAAASGVAPGDAGPDAAAPVGDEDGAEGTLVSETVATPKAKGPASGKARPGPAGDKDRSAAGAAAAAGAMAASAATAAAASAASAGATSAGAATAGAAATGTGWRPRHRRGSNPDDRPRAAIVRAAPGRIEASRSGACRDPGGARRGGHPGHRRGPSRGVPAGARRSVVPPVGRSDAARHRRWPWSRSPLVVGGAAAFLYLPTATAVIAPREGTIGPESLRIVASTTATAPDASASPPVVPAELLTIDVEASDTFPATGQRIEEAKATGKRAVRQPRPDQLEQRSRGAASSAPGPASGSARTGP